MAEGRYTHLISIITEYKEVGDASRKVEQIGAALDKTGAIAPKLDTQMKSIATAMRGVVPPEMEGKLEGIFKSFEDGNKVTQLSARQVDLLSKSLFSVGASKEQVKAITTNLQEMGIVTIKTSGMMEQLSLAMRRALIVAPVWMIIRGAIQAVTKLIGEQIKFLRDMEDAMARIQIVGKGTAKQYESMKLSLMGLALAYGVSASEALESAKIFAQQGKTVSETIVLTRAAMIGAQVLGKDVKTVVEDLTAAMKAFNIPAQDVISIVDQLINVEKQFAVTSKDLSEGIKTTGATASQMGVSIQALTGDLTAVIEVTRKSGSEAARGLQFIYARLLTSAKPIIEQLTGINFYLDKQGKVTSALTGDLRSATDILDELAGKWNNLSTEQKLNIAVATGSKRQLTVLNALMLNYAHSIDARIAALTSAGEAEKALSILQDTVTYKTKQLTSAWNTLTVSVANTSAWKAALDAITRVIIVSAGLISPSKVYTTVLAQETAKILTEIETRRNQINSIEELIKLRNRLLTEPPSEKTTERLQKVTNAIEKVTQEEHKIKVAIETGKPEELKKSVEEIRDELLRRDVALQVNLEFAVQLDPLKDKLKQTQKEIEGAPWGLDIIFKRPALKEQAKLQKEIADLSKKQTEEEEKQLILARAQDIKQQLEAEDEELRIQGKLTSGEKERLSIESQLIRFRLQEGATTEQLIQKRIQLIEQSKILARDHARTVELAELENKLLEERVRLKEQERNKVASLAMQYEKADMFEKGRIRRATELMKMTPKELAIAYEENIYDKTIIQDYWSSFTETGQRAVENIAMKINDLSPIKVETEIEALEKLEQTTAKLREIEVRYAGGIPSVTPPPPISEVQKIINNVYNIDVELEGAITDQNIKELLMKFEEKLKTQPNYISDTTLDTMINELNKSEEAQKRLGRILSDNV